MLETEIDISATVTDSHRATVRVDSWLGEDLLAENIPVIGGVYSADRTTRIPERLSLVVPRRDDDGTDWAPTSHADPLNFYGQRLRVSRGVVVAGVEVLVPLGWVVIQSWEATDEAVTVEAEGLLRLVEDFRFLAAEQPPGGATFTSEVRRLIAGIMPVEVDAGLTNRSLPTFKVWEESRLDALFEVARSWPAEVSVDDQGVVVLSPVLTENPAAEDIVKTFTDGEDGTIVNWTTGGDRESLYNAVVARGEETGDPNVKPVSDIAYNNTPDSPTRWGGPFGFVPRYYSSPLITTKAQALSAAKAILSQSLRKETVLDVAAVPDPRLVLGDPTAVVFEGTTWRGRLDAYSVPLLPADGAGTYRVTVGSEVAG